jgi:hypothetical protein
MRRPSTAPPAAHAETASVSPADTTVDVGNTFTRRIVSDAFPALGDALTSMGRA